MNVSTNDMLVCLAFDFEWEEAVPIFDDAGMGTRLKTLPVKAVLIGVCG